MWGLNGREMWKGRAGGLGAVQLRRAACCGRGRAEAGLLTAGDQCLYGVSLSHSFVSR